MNIREYLLTKYDTRTATTMLFCEAKAFGIHYPLQAGWGLEHGTREIDAALAGRLRAALSKSKAPSAIEGLRVLNAAGL